VILSLMPGAAWAQSCAVQRPDWDGTSVSAVQEAVFLASSPAALILLLGTVVAIRFKSQWGALAVVLGWTAFVTFLTMLAPASRKVAMAEGCVGSPALFIGIIAAICVGMIFYTAPPIKGR
jgi:hypothetical protein